MQIIRKGKVIELTQQELQQAVEEYEQKENIFATQKWSLEDIYLLLQQNIEIASFTNEDVKAISQRCKSVLEDCSDNYEKIQTCIDDYFREKSKILNDMNALGYELTQIDGFSDDFLMWKAKDKVGSDNSIGFDGWDAVRNFVNNVYTLMNSYTVQKIKDRVNGDYSIIKYGLFSDTEVQTALNCVEICK